MITPGYGDVSRNMIQLKCSMRRATIAAVAIWMIIFIYLAISIFTLQSKEREDRNEPQKKTDPLVIKYEESRKKIISLYENIDELKRLLSEKDALLSGNPKLKLIPIAGNGKSESRDEIPHTLYTKDHEMARRNLDNSIKELFYYLNSQFEHAKYLSFANHAINQTLSLIAQSAAFSSVDRADRWREKALASISEEMQLHLDKLQHPSDCATARALICTLNKGCGFGCQLHHVTYCFIVAYGTNRTLILHRDGKEWNYSERGWSAAFRPVSGCKHDQISKVLHSDLCLRL
ncbi:unnamed protein product [Anisakis simplex]|uniref:Alpha-(1,6)-fucosyltransferase (inferred by orthology to a human protein) n=1 Tax=Anisakis simplex TaxID=6269 RepID=A0A0M3K6K7_ANISI|nr:unnamed protein product [Anisakis simplex]